MNDDLLCCTSKLISDGYARSKSLPDMIRTLAYRPRNIAVAVSRNALSSDTNIRLRWLTDKYTS